MGAKKTKKEGIKEKLYCPNHRGEKIATHGYNFCAKCRAKKRKRAAEIKAQRRAQGLCPICGKRPIDEGFLSCAICRENARNDRAKSRARIRELKGIQKRPRKKREPGDHSCSKCGRDFVFEGVTCVDCSMYGKAFWRKEKLPEGALCEECKHHRPLLGFPYCRSCLEKLRLTAPEKVLPLYPDYVLDRYMSWLKGEF